MPQVQSFSQGKVPDRNEDYFASNENSFVLADGATDKSGRKYEGQTGGEIVSRLVVKEALGTSLNGAPLIDYLNDKVRALYKRLNIMGDISDPRYRFTGTCIVVRLLENKVVITYVGDSSFRINGQKVYREVMLVDLDSAVERSRYIKETGDVAGSREHLMPFLFKQFLYQNNPDQALGYGVIDGTKTPEKFVKTLVYPKNEIQLIELFTDGYPAIPVETTIDAWENAFAQAEKEDPDRWKKYKSTKSKDDRTIAIIKF